MSVLIKTMEMPKNCGECQFCHTENFTQWCCPTGREDVSYDSIPKWCPLEEPKTGEWEPQFADVPNECSECGEYWDKYVYGQEIWYTGELPKFCPNCGARMLGGEEEWQGKKQ